MEGDNVISSDRRRRRRAVDGEQLLALGARRAKTRCTKEDGVGRAAVVIIDRDGVAPPPPVAELSALARWPRRPVACQEWFSAVRTSFLRARLKDASRARRAFLDQKRR